MTHVKLEIAEYETETLRCMSYKRKESKDDCEN